ncbi:MAG TPA: glycosyltransferase [Acidobacteriota bacterium]|jgi:glycosyltransferase involved in cell wall biosynthesis|nr:glycosyltransferase [Acidobacteriota bacterium]
MKVAQIGVAHPYRGGIAHYTTSLHQALQQRGHNCCIISFSRLYPSLIFPGSSQFDQSVKAFASDAQPLLDSLNPLSWRAAATRILELRPDVAVFQYWHPLFAPVYSAVVSRLRGQAPPIVLICHNVEPHESHVAAKFLRDRLFGKVQQFLVHSEKDQQALRQLRPDARVLRAPHPAYHLFDDPSLSRQAARGKLGITQDEHVLLFFGYVRKYKGLDTLLRSLPEILKRQPVRLIIAGEFYESRDKSDRLIRTLGIQSRVAIHDRYIPNEEVAAYFKAADLLVAPYHSATQSGIVPTAYAFDLPVVTTTVGGLAEVVLQGKTGFLVPPGDPAALADAVAKFFRNGQQAEFREHVRKFKVQLSWNNIVDGIETLAGLGEMGTGEKGTDPN